jgi:hypothetical protein
MLMPVPVITSSPASELRRFIDAVVVPALLERFLREHESTRGPVERPAA